MIFSIFFSLPLVSVFVFVISHADENTNDGDSGKRFVFETREQKDKWENELVGELTDFFKRRSEMRKRQNEISSEDSGKSSQITTAVTTLSPLEIRIHRRFETELKHIPSKYHTIYMDKIRAEEENKDLRDELGITKNNLTIVETNLEKCQDASFFRSLLDLFSKGHYPAWYGKKTKEKGEIWDRALMNVKDNVINKIKCLLRKDSVIDEEYFKTTIVHHAGYQFSGSELHLRSLTPEVETVIKKCVKLSYPFASETIERIVNLMIEDVKGNISGIHALCKEYGLLDEEISVNDVKRLELYKVLRITNVHPLLHDEMKLKEEFAKGNPVLVWFNEKADIAYILYRSFSEAYSAWEKAKKTAGSYTKDGQASNIAIINQYTDIPDCDTLCTVKVFCNVDEKYDKEFSTENYDPKCNRQNRGVTFYEYRHILDAVQALQKNKNNVKNFCPDTKAPAEIQLIKNPSSNQ